MSEVIKGIFNITNRIERQYALITILFILTQIKKTIPNELNRLMHTLYLNNSIFNEIMPNFTLDAFIELVSPVLILTASFSMLAFVPFIGMLIFINEHSKFNVTLDGRNLVANVMVVYFSIMPLNSCIILNQIYYIVFGKVSSILESIIGGEALPWYYLGIWLVLLIDILGLVGLIKNSVFEEK